MSQISLPYTFTANTLIQSAQVNSNFTTITGVVNGQLDSTNVNASVGIGANYIVSSGNGATGSFQGGAYTFTAGAVGSVPLTVTGITNQTADLFDITLTSGGTKAFYVNNKGAVGPIAFLAGTSPTATSGASTPYVLGDGNVLQLAFTSILAEQMAVRFDAAQSGDSVGAALHYIGSLTNYGNLGLIGGLSVGVTSVATGLTAGDVYLNHSGTTATLHMAASATLDYGVTTPSVLTANKALTVTGTVTTSVGFQVGSTANAAIFGSSGNNNAYVGVLGTATGGTVTVYPNGTSSPGTATFSANGNFAAAGQISAGAGVAVGGALTGATTGSFSSTLLGVNVAASSGAFSSPGSNLAGGDLVAQRLASHTGVLWLGDSTTDGSLDYNWNVTASFAFKNSNFGTYAPVSGGAYTNASDRRWKKDIKRVRYGLPEVERLRPVRYEWKHDGRVDLGFIAQDIEPIIPELVKTDTKGYKMLNYDGLIPVLVAAIQELSERVDELE